MHASHPKESNVVTNGIVEMWENGMKSFTLELGLDLFLSEVLIMWHENGAKYLGYLDVAKTR